MRVDRQAQSLHYFHSYAVKDRIDLQNFSDIPPNPPKHATTELLLKLLPSIDDVHTIHTLFETHISRVLVERLPFMKVFSDVVDWHIEHEFSAQMAQKSEVVSLPTATRCL